MRSIMKCCIILHNMIIEYEREASSKDYETIWRKEREERDEGAGVDSSYDWLIFWILLFYTALVILIFLEYYYYAK